MSDDANMASSRPALLVEPSVAEDDAQEQRSKLFALLRGRYHWAILLAVILGGGAAVAGYYSVTPVYESTGAVRIAPELRPVLEGTEATEPIRQYESYLDLQAALLQSREVVSLAVKQEPWRQLGLGDTLADVAYFSDRLEVDWERRQQYLRVSFTDEQPAVAAAAVQSVIQAYDRVYTDQITREDAEILRTLEQRREQLRQEFEARQQQKQQLLQDYGVDGLGQRYQLQLGELWRVKQMLQQVQLMIDAATGEQQTPATAVTVEQIAMNDPEVAELLRQKNQVENLIQRNVQMGMGENHRTMRQARAELDAINRQLNEYVVRYRQSPTAAATGQMVDPFLGSAATLEDLRARKAELQKLHDQIEAETQALARRQLAASRIDEELASIQGRMARTEARMDTLRTEASGADRLEVISRGNMPTSPANDDTRKQLAALGLIGGTGMGFGIVILFGLLDRRFRRLDDAHAILPTTRMLGILPTLPENMADPEQVAVAAHCVHHIRTMLQIGREGQQGRVFAITSPAPGSGKTSLTTALGLSFATSETRTLLIDCDVVGGGLTRRMASVAHRSLEQVLLRQGMVDEQAIKEAHRRGDDLGRALVDMGELSQEDLDQALALQRESSVGLLEACDGEPFDACVADTGIKNLYILPLGTALPHQAGVLSPSAVHRLLAQARNRFDTVLIDTGPILGSIEASMAAAEADGTVLVVSRGDQKAMVLKSLDNLHAVNAKVTGIVFNHATAYDVERSSYASVTSGPARPAHERPQLEVIDPATSARFGPVGTAVASCSRSGAEQPPARNGQRNGNHVNGGGRRVAP